MKTKLFLLVFVLSSITALTQTNDLIGFTQPGIVVTTVPAPDKVTLVMDRAQTWLSGVLTVLAAAATWWAANRHKVASVVPTLIRSIETHGSDALQKQIKDAAGTAGVEPTLNKLVKSHTLPEVKILAPTPATVIVEGLKADAK